MDRKRLAILVWRALLGAGVIGTVPAVNNCRADVDVEDNDSEFEDFVDDAEDLFDD